MTLQAGTSVGHFEIVSLLGAGGMGEVYRARDTKLHREVALKVLPELFTADPDRFARFTREAQTLAALNHPNIAHVHGLEESPSTRPGQPGVRALVMELVDGEDLSALIARGPMALADALPIARQIAVALEAAHEHGIVHRDLKPANVKVTRDGDVKVLDFGLAKALNGEDAFLGGTAGLANSPTFTSPRLRPAHGAGTEAGVIIGTAAYMAPEQAKGKRVDRRADIWAFGCVLFEMLGGRRPFGGEGLTETLAAIVRDQPDWSALPSATPPQVRALIERCLEKDPKERLRDIGEARIALTRGVSAPAAPSRERTNWPARAAWVAIGVVVGASAIAMVMPRRDAPAPAVLSLRQLTELPGAEMNPDISPDGREVLFASASSGNSDLYLLRVGGGRAINLTAASTANDAQGAFSPDGDRIAFRSDRDGGGIFVMGATGDSVRRITSTGFDPRWSPDGKQLAYASEAVRDPYSRSVVAELWTVDIASGAAKLLSKGDAVQPSWSPSGQRIAYWSNTAGQRDIVTIAASGGTPVQVTQDAATDWAPEWSPDGRWLYFVSDRSGSPNLWRVAIDQSSGAVGGAPEALTNGVRALASARFTHDGSRMVVGATDRSFELLLYSFDPARPETPSLRSTIRSASLGWCGPSPDAAWLACTSRGGGQEDIVLLRSDGGETRRLTDDAVKDRIPTWSPDGRRLSFMSARSGRWELWAIGADGSGLRQMTNFQGDVAWGAWSPDGKRMAAAPYSDIAGAWFIDAVTGIGSRENSPFVRMGSGRVSLDTWSSDGTLVAGMQLDAGGDPLSIEVWDVKAQRIHRRVQTPLLRPTTIDVSFVPGTHLLTASGREGVVLIDADTGVTRRILPQAAPYGTRLSGDGRTLLVERPGMEADLWLMELKK